MLVEFSVANYRSIKEVQKLSMVAGASASRRHQHSLESGNSYAPHILRSACLFGPNGAGKTSLIKALTFFRYFVLGSSRSASEGDSINVKPFKADDACLNSPSDFEITFIFEGALYQYGFSADKNTVHEEWMFTRSNTPNSRIRTVFQRALDSDTGDYEWDISEDIVKGERETWRKATRSNALFLSTAVQLNSESLLAPYRWIDRYLRVVSSPERLDVEMTAKWAEVPARKLQVLELFRSFDLPIVDFKVEEKDLAISAEVEKMFSLEFLETLKKTSIEKKDYSVETFHQAGDRYISYDLKDESDGTRVIFCLAGPLLETTNRGYTLIVDELHNSLHPVALRFLVELFHDPEINQSGAQLIFTSHDTAVMSKEFMHRDQIWLVDRTELGGTELVPLSDFKVRETQSFQRAYLGGKYGALPRIQRPHLGQE